MSATLRSIGSSAPFRITSGLLRMVAIASAKVGARVATNAESGGKLGVGVAASEVGQGEQGLTAGRKAPPSRPDLLLPGAELLRVRQYREARLGRSIDEGWTSTAKLLAVRAILVVNPSAWSFFAVYSGPTRSQTPQVGKGSLLVVFVLLFVFLFLGPLFVLFLFLGPLFVFVLLFPVLARALVRFVFACRFLLF